MLSKQLNSFAKIITHKYPYYKPNRGLKFFGRLGKQSDAAFENLKFDDAVIENMKNPQHEFVKPGKEKLVGGWLLLTAGAVFLMISVGGYTRLSKSGLSMTRWKPIGYRYPSTQEQWQDEFENYKKFPEYQIANKEMSLEGFKFIFFVEYAHRLLGNAIGFLYGLPLIYFMARGYIRPKLRNRCLGLLAFGAAQGLVGWWMVKSGFDKKPDYQSRPRVSTYRLFVHLNNAILIYGILLWNGLNLVRQSQEKLLTQSTMASTLSVRAKMIGLIHFVALNVITGVTVAGIDAGKVFNTWPDMNGGFIPSGYLNKEPLWRNFFENCGTVQFNHRMSAYATFLGIFYLFMKSRSMQLLPDTRRALFLLFFLINYQVFLGIMTVLEQVPLEKGVAHQANALLVLSAAILTLHTARKPSAKYLYYLKNVVNKP